jgi:hypothetical protein
MALAAKTNAEGVVVDVILVGDFIPADYTPCNPWIGIGMQIDAPEPASTPPVPDAISFAQLLIGLVSEQWITEAEGEAWLAGTLPAPVLALIATLPAEQQFPAKARALRPSEVLRADPLVELLGAAQGKTPEQLDDFFRTYSEV